MVDRRGSLESSPTQAAPDFPPLIHQALTQYSQVLDLHCCIAGVVTAFDASLEKLLKVCKFQLQAPGTKTKDVSLTFTATESFTHDRLVTKEDLHLSGGTGTPEDMSDCDERTDIEDLEVDRVRKKCVYESVTEIQDRIMNFAFEELTEFLQSERALIKELLILCRTIIPFHPNLTHVPQHLVAFLKDHWNMACVSTQSAVQLYNKYEDAFANLKQMLAASKTAGQAHKDQALCACRLAEEAANTAVENAKQLSHSFSRVASVALIATCVCIASLFSPAIEDHLLKFINFANGHVRKTIESALRRNTEILSIVQAGHACLEDIQNLRPEDYAAFFNKRRLGDSLERWKDHKQHFKQLQNCWNVINPHLKTFCKIGEEKLLELRDYKPGSLVPASFIEISQHLDFVLKRTMDYCWRSIETVLDPANLQSVITTRIHTKKLLQQSVESSTDLVDGADQLKMKESGCSGSPLVTGKQKRLARALLDYEVQLLECYLQWIQAGISPHNDVLPMEDFVRKMEASRSALSAHSLNQLTSDLWSFYFPSNASFLRASLLNHVSIVTSSTTMPQLPLPPPGYRLTEAMSSIMGLLVSPQLGIILKRRLPGLEAAKEIEIRNLVQAPKFKAMMRQPLNLAEHQITLAAGTTVDCLLPFGPIWVVSHRGVNVAVPASMLEFAVSTYPFRTTSLFECGLPGSSVSSSNGLLTSTQGASVNQTMKLRIYISQILEPVFGQLCHLETAIEKALLIGAAVSVSLLWDTDDALQDGVLPEATTSGNSGKENTTSTTAATFPIRSKVEVTDNTSLEGEATSSASKPLLETPVAGPDGEEQPPDSLMVQDEDQSAQNQSCIDLPTKPPTVIRRQVKSDFNRAATSVSTFGKNRPATLQQEFMWRFHHDNPKCKVIQHFSCALVGRILLQGKLYVTTTAIGFFSVFNDSTVFSSIPTLVLFELQQVKTVRKRPYAFIFQNALEFELKDGSIYFFASFLKRDKAWGLIMSLLGKETDDGSKRPFKLSDRVQSIINAARVDIISDDETLPDISARAADEESTLDLSGPLPDPKAPFPVTRREIDITRPRSPAPYPPPTPTKDGGTGPASNYPAEPFSLRQPILHMSNVTMAEALWFTQGNPDFIFRLQVKSGSIDVSCPGWTPCVDTAESGEAWIQQLCLLPAPPSREVTLKKKMSPNPILKIPPYAPVLDEQTMIFRPGNDGKAGGCRQAMLRGITHVSNVPFTDYFTLHNRFVFTEVADGIQLDGELFFEWHKSTFFKGKVESSALAEWKEGLEDYAAFATQELQAQLATSPLKAHLKSPPSIEDEVIAPPAKLEEQVHSKSPLAIASALPFSNLTLFFITVVLLGIAYIDLASKQSQILHEVQMLNLKYDLILQSQNS